MKDATIPGLLRALAAGALLIAGTGQPARAQSSVTLANLLIAEAAPVAAHPKIGKTFRDCPDCPEMVVIPPGTFVMGAPPDEPGYYDEDGPQRSVTIHQFAAGKFDITKGQWARFAAATNHPTSEGCQWSFLPKDKESKASWRYLSFEQGDNHPIVCVTWNDTRDYLAWLSQRSGHAYRLLSEAEWEYAARAGTKTPYPWGSKATHEYANYGRDDEAGHGLALGKDQWAISTSPVGAFPPNAFGLYDMHGNVLQWTADCFSPSYKGLPTDGSPWKTNVTFANLTGFFNSLNGTSSCSYRTLRGGDWGDTPQMIRSASRNWAPPSDSTLDNYSSSGLGIRVARDLK